MKKRNNELMKRIALGLIFAFSTKLASAQAFRSAINQALTDYMVPVIILILVMGVVIGLVRNWEEINNAQTRKQGLVNVGMILLYALIFVAAIAAVVSFSSGLSIQI